MKLTTHCAEKQIHQCNYLGTLIEKSWFIIIINANIHYLESSGQALILRIQLYFFLTYSLIRWVNIYAHSNQHLSFC